MWKIIKVNKTFCKPTTVVVTEAQRVLKANPRVYLVEIILPINREN